MVWQCCSSASGGAHGGEAGGDGGGGHGGRGASTWGGPCQVHLTLAPALSKALGFWLCATAACCAPNRVGGWGRLPHRRPPPPPHGRPWAACPLLTPSAHGQAWYGPTLMGGHAMPQPAWATGSACWRCAGPGLLKAGPAPPSQLTYPSAPGAAGGTSLLLPDRTPDPTPSAQ